METQETLSELSRGTILISAVNATNLASSSIYDLRGLFKAIREIAEKDSSVGHLAKLGHDLAGDWGHAVDCEREDLERVLNLLR